jgi:hypothetical protein
MAGYSKELIAETRDLWQRKTGCPVSDDDALEIIQNMTRLVKLLAKLDAKQSKKEENRPDQSN